MASGALLEDHRGSQAFVACLVRPEDAKPASLLVDVDVPSRRNRAHVGTAGRAELLPEKNAAACRPEAVAASDRRSGIRGALHGVVHEDQRRIAALSDLTQCAQRIAGALVAEARDCGRQGVDDNKVASLSSEVFVEAPEIAREAPRSVGHELDAA